MKAILYILVLAALLASSCATGGRYVKSEFDDLYYLPSDRVMVNKSIASHNLPGDLKQEEQYFDNIYSGDTLIAEQYNENVDFDNSLYYNKDYSPFEYMDDWSYSNRLRRFYGNYFYPYWRDPFYYSWNYTPWYYYDYFYNPYWGSLYDPFYYGMYPGMYYGFYGSYFGSFYSPYSFYYSGYYWPTYRFYYRDDFSSATEGRRERYSSLTNSYTSTSTRGRTTGYVPSTGGSTTNVASTSRRTESSLTSPRQSSSTDSKSGQIAQTRRDVSSSTRNVETRPEYSQVSRSYTPTYNNPRLSDRPSYNTSRVSTEAVQRSTPNTRTGNVGVYRSNSDSYFNSVERRAPSSYSVGQTRTVTPSSVGDYSAPSMRSVTRDASVSSSRRYESSSFSSGMSSGSVSSGSSGASIGSSGGGSSSGSVSTGTRR
ncbi:MAG: hypothetical protein WBJ37_11910 [Bacteroidales bacterium]